MNERPGEQFAPLAAHTGRAELATKAALVLTVCSFHMRPGAVALSREAIPQLSAVRPARPVYARPANLGRHDAPDSKPVRELVVGLAAELKRGQATFLLPISATSIACRAAPANPRHSRRPMLPRNQPRQLTGIRFLQRR